MLINRRHRRKQKPSCHRWRVEVGNVVVYTRNVQFGERHHRQWDSEALFFQALKLGDDELEQQVELLTRAIDLMPRDADCYINRGVARDAIGDAEGALADYNIAIRLNPRNAIAWNNRGFLRYKQQRFAEAIADFDRAIALDPDYLDPLVSRGAAYGTLGEHERALEDFQRAIDIDPDFLLARVNRAAYNMNLGRLDDARKELLEVLDLDPDNRSRSLAEQYLQMLADAIAKCSTQG
ncbi:MAG: tetratricopeptide repeat protein [Bacteroidales bacterium]|nr:tetratricopeptide repeat protein [Bacteroidales bacterium]